MLADTPFTRSRDTECGADPGMNIVINPINYYREGSLKIKHGWLKEQGYEYHHDKGSLGVYKTPLMGVGAR